MLLMITFLLVLALLRTVKLKKRGLRHLQGEKEKELLTKLTVQFLC